MIGVEGEIGEGRKETLAPRSSGCDRLFVRWKRDISSSICARLGKGGRFALGMGPHWRAPDSASLMDALGDLRLPHDESLKKTRANATAEISEQLASIDRTPPVKLGQS